MKKLQTLSKLIHVKSYNVNSRQQFVGKLRNRLGDIENEIQNHQHSLEKEGEAASKIPYGMVSFTHYAAMIRGKLEKLERFRREAEAQLAKEQDKLKDLYADLQVHEKIYNEAQEKIQFEKERKEQNTLDDLFSGRRRSGNSNDSNNDSGFTTMAM